MTWYPIFIDLDEAACLIVGGGEIALRKAEGLLACGAQITLIAPEICPDLESLAKKNHRLYLLREEYTQRDLSAYRLIFAATGRPAVNAQVAADATDAGVLVNVVDTPELCQFQAAAVVKRGPLQVAVHSGGVCPALSAALRAELEAALPESLGAYAMALGEIRKRLRDTCASVKERKHVLERLAARELRERCPYDDAVTIQRWIEDQMNPPDRLG
jgi:siroheme synthase-like protein